jgi:phage shock protein C
VHLTDDFYRDKSEGMIGGVCAGLAEYFAIRPLLLRLIFVLWALRSGASVLVYIALWIALPERDAIGLARGEALRLNVAEIQSEVQQWGQEVQDVFSSQRGTRTAPGKRVILLGSLLILMGLVFVVDRLHLLGPFRLHHLGPVVLILVGVVSLSRALQSGERRK